MVDDKTNPIIDSVREQYNAPGETPREEMWEVIAAQIHRDDGVSGDRATADVIDLPAERHSRHGMMAHPVRWAVAAAALLVMGVGIGRMTAPAGPSAHLAKERAANHAGLRYAAAELFEESESWLSMVQTDARVGQIDPETSEWARGLLSQTRLLMDAQSDDDTPTVELLEDLELVLIQIAGVTESESIGEERARTEMSLALSGLDDSELIQRLQEATPRFMAGT